MTAKDIIDRYNLSLIDWIVITSPPLPYDELRELYISSPRISQRFDHSKWMPILSGDVESIRSKIKHVIFHDPATIVIWQDGTKTVTKCHPDDSYDKEKGLMACIIKYLTGNTGRWNEILKDWIDYEADERKRLSTSQWEEKEPKG